MCIDVVVTDTGIGVSKPFIDLVAGDGVGIYNNVDVLVRCVRCV